MNDTNQKRTHRMLMREFQEMLGGPQMRDEYMRQVEPLADSTILDKEMTEAEYQFALGKMREELPAFKRYLLSLPHTRPGLSWSA